MSDAFSLAWAFLKQDDEEEEEEEQRQPTLFDYGQTAPAGESVFTAEQLEQGTVKPKIQMPQPLASIPKQFGGEVAESLFDEDGNLKLPDPTAAAPEQVKPVAVTPKTTGKKKIVRPKAVGVSPPKAKVEVEKVPWTDPKTGETRMVDRVQNIKAAERAPKFVPVKRGTKDESGNWRTKKVEPRLSQFAQANLQEAKEGLSEEEKGRRERIVEANLSDIVDDRIIETGGSTGETSPKLPGQRDHWMSPKPCEHCNRNFTDYTQGRMSACNPCATAAKKGPKNLEQRLTRLAKNPNHPVNLKKK